MVRQLQTFIQKYVSNGYISVSIHDECKQFERDNDVRPILLIDLHCLLRPLINDRIESTCGIRHNEVCKKLEKFLKNLTQIADLVFYSDGPTFSSKLPKWMKNQNEQYKNAGKITDKVLCGCSLEEIAYDENMPSTSTHLTVVEDLALMYGTVKVAVDRECDAEMAKFAFNNSRVFAILGDDSDFLIYPGNWRYFSLNDLNWETLETMEFNRIALREALNLNDKELVFLSTLNGNDIISYDDTRDFRNYRGRNNPSIRFPSIAEFIKSNRLLETQNLYEEIALAIFQNTNENYITKVKESFDLYDITFDLNEITDETQILCREKTYNFTFEVLNDMLHTFTLNVYDQRRSDNYFKSINCLFSKQIGIILKDKTLKSYKICSKLSFSDQEYSMIEIDPEIPEYSQPPLVELLDRSNYPQHDFVRFELLKWLIGKDKLENVDLKSIPKNIFLDILILVYMTNEGFINSAEADVILLSLKYVRDDSVPHDLSAPEIMHTRAFFVSLLFSKCHIYVRRSLEVTGLKGLAKIYDFDGVLFHSIYKKHINGRLNDSILEDLKEYRYYA